MAEPYGSGGMALAAWTLLHVLLVHMRETGALTDEARRDLLDRALRAVEVPSPDDDRADTLRDARRLLEEWM